VKKEYRKPFIVFESFTLSTNIAGDCGTIINNSSRNICPYITRTGLSVFMENINGCTTLDDDGDYNGYCYNVPIDELSLFNS
jgi:hypothetical protein